MTTENGGPDPYALVLADLKAKRDQIDQAITLIEGLRGIGGPGNIVPPGLMSGAVPPHDAAGNYLGMSIPDAAKKALHSQRRALGNAEIAKMLKDGGLVMTSADPVNTVGSVLTRRFNQVGDIVRVSRGMWGLKEWYPNRNFRASPKAASPSPEENEQATSYPTEPEQPSAQPDYDPLS